MLSFDLSVLDDSHWSSTIEDENLAVSYYHLHVFLECSYVLSQQVIKLYFFDYGKIVSY